MKSISDYWNKFLDTRPDLGHLANSMPETWSIGHSPEMAEELIELIIGGKKTATSSLLSVYKSGKEPMPQIGSYRIVTDGKKVPRCVIYITDLFVKKFTEVTEKHALEEGEGDGSLDYWLDVHMKIFSAYPDFSETSDILCERFRLVYKF